MPESDQSALAPAIATTVAPPAPARSPADLCRDVELSVEREPRDRVRCAHLFGDYFRCNWWARAGDPKAVRADYDWSVTLTDHVRQSRFLRVTSRPEGLRIEQVTARPGGGGAD